MVGKEAEDTVVFLHNGDHTLDTDTVVCGFRDWNLIFKNRSKLVAVDHIDA